LDRAEHRAVQLHTAGCGLEDGKLARKRA
jgi:hypothetical protein